MRLRIEMAQFNDAPPACRKATALIVTDEPATDVIFVEASEVGFTQSEHILELAL